MAKLIITPLGCSARDKLCVQLEQLEYGKGAIVLPNSLLLEDVRKKHNVEAIGIDTLANKLLNMNGYINFHQINRRSQELVVKDLLQALAERNNLDYFKELLQKTGFVKAMTSLVGQLSRSGSTQEQIIKALSEWDRSGHLGQKDKEVALLYQAYRQYLKNKQWFDLEGKYRLALRVLQAEKVNIPWEELCFCDFYSFDALQMDFLKALNKRCRLTIGLCYEKNLQGTEREKLFAATHDTYLELESLCLDEGIEEYVPERKVSDGCAHLVAGYGLNKAPLSQSDDVQLYCFTQQEQELRYTMTKVKYLLRQGVPAEQILVAVRDLNKFTGLRLIADEYGVPINLTWASGLAVQPLTEILLLLLAAAVDNHVGADAYIRILTAPLARLLLKIDGEKINQFREDVFFKARSSVQQKMQAEGLQDELLEIIDSFLEQIAPKANIVTYGEQMLGFLHKLQLEKNLGVLHREGKLEVSSMSVVLQSKCLLIKALQKLMEDYASCGLAEKVLTLAEWQQVLVETVKESEVDFQRGRRDGVLITEVNNLQGLAFDYVFILGLREGEFPKVNNENWIYNDGERKQLKEAGLDLPNTSLAYAEDAGFFGTAIGSASQQLVISYFKDDQAGASAYVGSVQKLFIDAQKKRDNKGEEEEQEQQVVVNPVKNYVSAEELSQGLQNLDCKWMQDYWGEVAMEAAQADFERAEDMLYNGVIADKNLQELVAKHVGSSFSASALEVYAACPFQFLGEKIWRQQEFAAMEDGLLPTIEGDLLHRTLEQFMNQHLNSRISDLPLADLQQELAAAFEQVSQQALEQGKIVNGLLWQAEAPRLLKLLQKWLQAEYKLQKPWNFTPSAIEWDFSSKNGKPLHLRLSDGTRVSLIGRADRIDCDGERAFIFDYKLGRAPGGKDLASGFDVQLPLYILAVAGLFKNAQRVAGASYYVMKTGERKSFLLEPVDNESISDAKKYTKDISQSWASFQSFAQSLITGYIEAIYAGNFAVAPRKNCSDYCQLKNICRLGVVAHAEGGQENE